MKAVPYILFFLFGVAVMMAISTEFNKKRRSGVDQYYKDKLDSIRVHYRELIKEDSITFIHYSLAKQEAVKATEAAEYYRKKYEHEKNKPVVRYTPNAVDSVLSAIYPR